MFNLLPPSDIQFLKTEHMLRRAAVILGFLFVSTVFALLFLMPSYVISYYRLNSLGKLIESFKGNAETKELKNLNDTVTVANRKIASLSAEEERKVTTVLFAVSRGRTPDIKVSSFLVQKNGTGKTAVSIKGRATTREGLLAFANRFKSDPAFETVDLPISNFAKEADIDFSMNLTMK